MGKIRPAVPIRPGPLSTLRVALDQLVQQYDDRYIDSDPLKFPHRYERFEDRELVGFISALLAFGNVKAIFQSVEKILVILSPRPYDALRSWPNRPSVDLLRFRHRWVGGEDLHRLFQALRGVYEEFGTLERFFLQGYSPDDISLEPAIRRFGGSLTDRIKHLGHKRAVSLGLRFLVPAPHRGGACKRLNLFLRWMVRRKPPDLALWHSVSPRQLLLPIDTHLARLVRYIGLTGVKTVNWKMVADVTAQLRRFDPDDPIRYDFALARLGILNRCRHRPDPECCPECLLRDVCVLNAGRY